MRVRRVQQSGRSLLVGEMSRSAAVPTLLDPWTQHPPGTGSEKTTGAYAARNGTVPGMVDEDRNFSEGVAAGYDGASAGMFEPSVVTPTVPEEGSRCRS